MGVSERDYAKTAVDEAPIPGFKMPEWVARLNAYGERHATAIISVSTALVIFIVLVFAKTAYDKSQIERAEQELASADTAEELKELKTKFGFTPAGPRIVFRLANRYYEDGKLDAARNEYREFQNRYPGDPLSKHVVRALGSLERNLKFESEGKEARLKQGLLTPHPTRLADAKDPRLQWGPVPSVTPTAELDLPGGTVKVELLEDEAPNAVAMFVKLAQDKYFDGLKVEPSGEGRLVTQPKAAGAVDYALAPDAPKSPAETGVLALFRKDGADVAGRFQIVLLPSADLKDAVVFGRIVEGLPTAQALKKDDAIRAVRITAKRDHPYEPKRK